MEKRNYNGNNVEKNARKFCSEDVSLIENYEQAKKDGYRGWCVHHRLEFLPCQNRWVSRQELKGRGIYYGRPAWELIFMRVGEHSKFHGKDPNTEQNLKKAQETAWHSEKRIEALRNSEKHKEAARQNLKKATVAARHSEKRKKAAAEAIAKTCRKPFTIDDVRYERLIDAASHFNVSDMTISNWLNGKRKTNHICKYL